MLLSNIHWHLWRTQPPPPLLFNGLFLMLGLLFLYDEIQFRLEKHIVTHSDTVSFSGYHIQRYMIFPCWSLVMSTLNTLESFHFRLQESIRVWNYPTTTDNEKKQWAKYWTTGSARLWSLREGKQTVWVPSIMQGFWLQAICELQSRAGYPNRAQKSCWIERKETGVW